MRRTRAGQTCDLQFGLPRSRAFLPEFLLDLAQPATPAGQSKLATETLALVHASRSHLDFDVRVLACDDNHSAFRWRREAHSARH